MYLIFKGGLRLFAQRDERQTPTASSGPLVPRRHLLLRRSDQGGSAPRVETAKGRPARLRHCPVGDHGQPHLHGVPEHAARAAVQPGLHSAHRHRRGRARVRSDRVRRARLGRGAADAHVGAGGRAQDLQAAGQSRKNPITAGKNILLK